MKIAESAIKLLSQHAALEKNEKKEPLTVWKSGQDRRVSTDNTGKQELESLRRKALEQSVKVSLSAEARSYKSVKESSAVSSEQGEAVTDLNLRILQLLVERLTGRKMNVKDIASIVGEENVPVVQPPSGNGQTVPTQSPGFGAVYEYHESHYESESTSFNAQGKILTEDGREIDFSIQLNMAREFSSQVDEVIRMGEALKDPLVINFNGTAAELTQTQFKFDLNSDGMDEQIAFVGSGSGFLALDKNGDNSINNGTELFGPVTGNGFNELATYDSDGNNWIDENDAIYGNLRIWTKDSAGKDQLYTLSQKGVGALFLGNVATPFSMKNGENELVGQVRSTGVFLQENGIAGAVQQIDLVA
jgi:hypothetical protein